MEGIVGSDLLTLFTRRRFCSLPFTQNIMILEFFGSDLHLDFCIYSMPHPPDNLSQSTEPDFSLFLFLYTATRIFVNVTPRCYLSHP